MRRFEGIITILVILISGIIGWSTSFVNTATAGNKPVVIPKVIVPNVANGFNLNIDLKKGKVAVNDTEREVNVNINQKDSIVVRYKTLVVKEPVYLIRREFPLAKERKTVVSPKFEMPKTIELN